MKKERTQKSAERDPCAENIRRSGTALNRCIEIRCAHIFEKIRDLLYNTDKARLFERLPETFPGMIASFSCDAGSGSPFDRELSCFRSASNRFDGVTAAAFLRKAAGYPDTPFSYFNIEAEEVSGERVSYFRNPLTDEAFSKFSKKMTSPLLSYASDLHSVCEAVYDEKSHYGILPLYNSREGRLSGFYGLVDKYELYVTSECAVYSADNETVTRFALLSKHPRGETPVTGKELFFEFRIPHDGETLQTLLFSAEYYGLQNVMSDSLPSESKNADVLMFKGKGENVCDMLFYMYCTDIQYTLIGVYEE